MSVSTRQVINLAKTKTYEGIEILKKEAKPHIDSLDKRLTPLAKTLIFAVGSLFTMQFAFKRVLLAGAATLYFKTKKEHKIEKILTIENLALTTIGTLGLILHTLLSPFSNPLLYFSPALSAIALVNTGYNLYKIAQTTRQINFAFKI